MNLVLSVALAMAVCWVQYSHQQEGSEKAVVLCGRQLAQARMLLCYGTQLVKRDDKFAITDMNSDDMAEFPQQWPWMGRQSAMTAQWGRNKRGNSLVEECCLKPCTADELLNYC